MPADGPPKGKKYQPDPNGDYETGDSTTGWRCLKFAMTQPQYYQYGYNAGGGYKSTEFWITLIVTALGALMASGVFGDDSQAAKVVGGALALAAQFGYNGGRAWVKAKSAALPAPEPAPEPAPAPPAEG